MSYLIQLLLSLHEINHSQYIFMYDKPVTGFAIALFDIVWSTLLDFW